MQRKRYTVEFKEQVLKEVREVGNAAQVARRHGLTPKVLYDWMAKSKHQDWQTSSPEAKKVASYIPSPAGKGDYYFDKSGNTVPKNSIKSHIEPTQ